MFRIEEHQVFPLGFRPAKADEALLELGDVHAESGLDRHDDH